jgi:hypothetical protein
MPIPASCRILTGISDKESSPGSFGAGQVLSSNLRLQVTKTTNHKAQRQ